jgi:hypothetical protein
VLQLKPARGGSLARQILGLGIGASNWLRKKIGRRSAVTAAGVILAAALGAFLALTVSPGAGGSDPTPTVPQPSSPPPGVTTGPPPVILAFLRPKQVIYLPSDRRCVRRLGLRFSTPRGVQLQSLVINVGRRRIARNPPPRLLMVRSLPHHHFTIIVTVTTTGRQTVVRLRRYRNCAR